MFARVLFLVLVALALNRAELVGFRMLDLGYWSYPNERAHEIAPPRHASEGPLVVVQAPPTVALPARPGEDRERHALIAGALAVLPVVLWQWLAPKLPSMLDAVALILRARH